jgi:kynurenine formamidase
VLIDLSHTIEHGMTTYPGLPAPLICDYLSRQASRAKYAAGVEFQIGKIEMVANTGTYLDSPFHRYADGKDLAAMPLEKLAGLDAVVIRLPAGAPRAIGWAAFERVDVHDRAVLVATGWDRHWRTERYGRENPFLTADACEGCGMPGLRWWGSIPSTSTTSTTGPGRRTRSSSAPRSRSSSTCATWRLCRTEGSGSPRCRRRWRGSGRFR